MRIEYMHPPQPVWQVLEKLRISEFTTTANSINISAESPSARACLILSRAEWDRLKTYVDRAISAVPDLPFPS